MFGSQVFTSKRERKLWIGVIVVLLAINSTLWFGGQLIDLMVGKRLIEQSMFYAFLLLVAAFILSGFKSSGRQLEFWIYAGITVVIGMTFFRMELTTSERSHMFEYGMLGILVYQAFLERSNNGASIKYPALMGILVAGTVGLLDEIIQYFIPYRVFDLVDIGFNYFAATFGILTSMGASWLQRIVTKMFKG